MPNVPEILGKIIAWIITIAGAYGLLAGSYSFPSWINDNYFRGLNIIGMIIALLMFSAGIAVLIATRKSKKGV